ncbi:hypothetical protein [Legionella bozemanae]|uniref:Uncharacterized protein n=1 Tax=Legionella bozemanae TaxID=447 RepID=A0A0W0R6N5_LEGBO|nr:hypothetical protein [Legionella bozemanae]KTC66735.1 hypothetical protein Lboz_3630 [Legionella bozemanae]STO34645.1 Uncharacterised protein [Legionella bozemanae]
MKVQKIKLSSYDVTKRVLDDNHLPKSIIEFVRYLNNDVVKQNDTTEIGHTNAFFLQGANSGVLG